MASDEKENKITVVQVSNISVSATYDHIFTLCQYVGRIEELKVYPSDNNVTSNTTQKIAFVRFRDERCVEVAQHLTNTVLIDRAIVCIPWVQGSIPDETTFLNSGGPVMAGVRLLPPHVINKVQTDAEGTSVLLTVDPTLEQLGLPAYPSLPGDTDASKVEEIRRTVYVGNLPKDVDGEAVLEFFNGFIGEVMYVRMASGPSTLPCAYAYVEFSQQTTVPIALQNNGIEFKGRNLKIQHSRVAIIKPQQKTADQALEEVEEAIRMGRTGDEKRSGSPRRRRSPSPRRRDRSRSRRRSRSPQRDRRRSRSRDRKRSRSRDRRRSRSRDRASRRRRSPDRRSRSRDRKRSRSRDRKRERKEKRRTKSRSRSPSRDNKGNKSERSDNQKDRDDKSARESASEEEILRQKLLESTGKTETSSPVSEEKRDKTPSKIKNERKRTYSDSE